ncbi:MAG: hypothetical protein KDA80_16120 [Planctomycetaceae bacterium]|nr:hypothetical protein [Planctomycetaceae bacterium]
MKRLKTLLVAGALAGSLPMVFPAPSAVAQEQVVEGQIDHAQLGELLAALALNPEKKEERYDFAFTAEMDGQEWQLSMSAVMSQDGQGIWIMAWLSELPKSSDQVPKTALLKLLAQNDFLGNGKFFSFVPAARRFVMQKVVPNEHMTSARLRVHLQDLGGAVVETYPLWNTANWNGIPAAPTGVSPNQPPTQSAANESKFQQPVRR